MAPTRDPKIERARQPGRGRGAKRPSEIPARGWKDTLWRVWASIGTDHVSLVAAGTAFFLILALFPAMTALVSIYGLIANPGTIQTHVAALQGVVPEQALQIVESQLERIVTQSGTTHGVAFLGGLVAALWSANAGMKSLFEAMNVAYAEDEKRSFVRLNLVALAFTLGAIAVLILFMFAIAVVPAIIAFLALGEVVDWLVSILRWPIVLVLAGLALAVLYRFGPSRERAEWRWVTWGSAFASVAWLVASMLFSWYLSNFADYNETYGSLGAAIGLMMWFWISVLVILVGAELNAELEHQTAEDTTTGTEEPFERRGAAMAERVGPGSDESG